MSRNDFAHRITPFRIYLQLKSPSGSPAAEFYIAGAIGYLAVIPRIYKKLAVIGNCAGARRKL